jgi:hypothetical protein
MSFPVPHEQHPHSPTFRITNYKISRRADKVLISSFLHQFSEKFPRRLTSHKCCSVLQDKFTYTFYPSSGLINITKISLRTVIPAAIQHFEEIVRRVDPELAERIVSSYGDPWSLDNVSAAGCFGFKLRLGDLRVAVTGDALGEPAQFKYNLESFSGAFTQFRPAAGSGKELRRGTLCAFASGKYWIVGVRDEGRAQHIFEIMSAATMQARAP